MSEISYFHDSLLNINFSESKPFCHYMYRKMLSFTKVMTTEPVSYTHLDVYKRQTRSWSRLGGC